MKVEFNRILCTTDLTEMSNHSVSYGLALAGEFHSTIYVSYIVDLPITSVPGSAYINAPEYQNQLMNYASEEIESTMKDSGVQWEPVVCIVPHARFELATGANFTIRLICSHFKPRNQLIDQFLEFCRIGTPPRCIQACVAENHHPASSILKGKLGKLVQRIGCPTGSATACAGQNEALHTMRIAQGKLLRHHAAE